jgi:hypothetical protein
MIITIFCFTFIQSVYNYVPEKGTWCCSYSVVTIKVNPTLVPYHYHHHHYNEMENFVNTVNKHFKVPENGGTTLIDITQFLKDTDCSMDLLLFLSLMNC